MSQNKDKKLKVLNQSSEEQTQALPTFEKLHSKPVTRRDFLTTGLLPFSATMFMPNWLNIFAGAGVARAEDLVCQATGGGDLAAFITLKLSGGAAMSANFVPLDKGGQLLPSYSKMGMGKGSSLQVVNLFANSVPFYNLSGMMNGITAQASALTLMKTAMVGVPVRSQDDSAGNKFDISGLVGKSGLVGQILPNMGRSNTETGLNATYALLKPSAPLVVSRLEDVIGSLGVSGSLAKLSQPQKEKLFNTINGLTKAQAQEIQNMSGGQTLSNLMQCANLGNINLIQNSTSLNVSPLTNPDISRIWNITNNSSTSSQDFVFATMVFNAINGNAGTVNLDIGGYDYHDGTRTNGDTKDNQAGVVIGRILESFAAMGKKGFLMVCSDGGVSSAESDSGGTPWMSDRGTSGVMYMIAYDPSLTPMTKGTQLGNFTDGQVADDSTLTGGVAEKAAAAIFANYLSFNGKLGLFESIAPRYFSPEELEKIRMIG